MTAIRTETILSELLTDVPPALEAPAFLRSLDLIPRRVPAWVVDEATRKSILDGFLDVPDDLMGSRS
ncbi:hypothetical protein OG730_34705 [Streptomyces sp. NBC_01298]|uniref:hypothetical protein n=1 Tax=Streptomyces sp. NBC_01298 TaxID=2903817 RepID=UPI002E10B0C5|nr:hypothetical protein OG730_34705 [Streptomyces sp. NBC_01298]